MKVDVANPSGKKGESGSKLYVGNINYNVTVEQLTKLFEQFGEVTHVNLLEGRGYGFIEFTTQDNAQKAKEELDGKDFEGRNIKIDFAGKKKDNQRPNRGNERYNSRY
ncbi:MAG: RNA-binding protein [candidate division Zixibacteria bacterium]|nr:RNA-binding protein [candidate division Zixibacteria bacterium]